MHSGWTRVAAAAASHKSTHVAAQPSPLPAIISGWTVGCLSALMAGLAVLTQLGAIDSDRTRDGSRDVATLSVFAAMLACIAGVMLVLSYRLAKKQREQLSMTDKGLASVPI